MSDRLALIEEYRTLVRESGERCLRDDERQHLEELREAIGWLYVGRPLVPDASTFAVETASSIPPTTPSLTPPTSVEGFVQSSVESIESIDALGGTLPMIDVL